MTLESKSLESLEKTVRLIRMYKEQIEMLEDAIPGQLAEVRSECATEEESKRTLGYLYWQMQEIKVPLLSKTFGVAHNFINKLSGDAVAEIYCLCCDNFHPRRFSSRSELAEIRIAEKNGEWLCPKCREENNKISA